MKKSEFEKKIKELDVEKVYPQGRKDEHIREFYKDSRENIYGCYYNDVEYIIFYKDIERGMIKEFGRFKTEDEAYDKLFEKIVKWVKNKFSISKKIWEITHGKKSKK